MTGDTFRLIDMTHGRVVAERVRRARGPLGRLTGLLGRSKLGPGEGIWLAPCNGIHTFGMRFPIDAIVLDRNLCAVRLAHSVGPNRVVLPCVGGQSTVELAAGTLRSTGVQVGHQLVLR